MAQQLRIGLGCPSLIAGDLSLNPGSASNSAFLVLLTLGVKSDGSRMSLCPHLGDPDGIPKLMSSADSSTSRHFWK